VASKSLLRVLRQQQQLCLQVAALVLPREHPQLEPVADRGHHLLVEAEVAVKLP
jgi:hypothetical protein